MTQAQTPQFGEARVAPFHLSGSSVASTDVFNSMASIVVANSVWHAQEPIVDKDWIEFSALASDWIRETILSSSMRTIFASKPYLAILAMPPDKVVPLILRQIIREGSTPYHWFAALVALTNENPAGTEENVIAIANRWIEWGRARYGRQLGPE
jgi:hypothetical protein